MPSHTPGPWEAIRHESELDFLATIQDAEDSTIICRVLGDPDDANALGDVLLIAAAPDLLESLDNVSAALETMLVHFGSQISSADASQRTTILEQARRLVDRLQCEGCDGSGIRPHSTTQSDLAPEGFVFVERCDSCQQFEDDLCAANAWGEEARWHRIHAAPGGLAAIAKPKAD